MTFGLPQNLAPRLTSSAFQRVANLAAIVSLGFGAVMLISYQLWAPSSIVWPAVIALIPMGFALLYRFRSNTRSHSVVYLAISALTVFTVTWIVVAQLSPSQVESFPMFQQVKVATFLIGGVGIGLARALLWTTVGYITAEVSAAIAIVAIGEMWSFDLVTGGAFGTLVILAVIAGLDGPRARRVEASLRRAAHDDVASEVAYRVRQRASAILHDTVLNQLTAISLTQDAGLRPELASELRRDIDLVEGASLGEPIDAPLAHIAQSAGWGDHPVHDVIRAAQASGLDVDITGDPDACGVLSRDNASIAALAIAQCLVNVERHSGVTEAEVAIHAAGDDVMFMVIDGGRGFDLASVPPNRLGIRNSIQGRIESAGGTVQLWTGVGTGTSVVIQIPRGTQDDTDVVVTNGGSPVSNGSTGGRP